ncbi:NEL-type E3 ubiquitin ligase domain-containing protein [Pseudomonas sp. DSP3-2-2]|uniref:NEL-type E3 ubiquitin ligase domain-containing protein n=1 Tax=unclassified Pseudomonas TaxID=196821 RepID=UPI003CEA05AA
MTSTIAQPHHQLISDTLPAWYVEATAATRQTLNRDMVSGQQLRQQWDQTLADIQPLDEFARPLLIKALDDEFGPGLDVDNTYVFKDIYQRGAFGQLQLAPPEVCLQTLLHAALQNFHQEEVDAPHKSGRVRIVDIRHVTDQRYGSYDEYPRHPMNIDPGRFMRVCRELDLGGKYQLHLDSVVGSFSGDPAETAAQVADLCGRKELNALQVQAHIAYMRKDISETFYTHLLALPERARSSALDYGCLKICGFSVRDILVFRIKSEETCVIYVPGEPVQGMKEFDSFAQLKRLLNHRFTPTYCKGFMNRFIAQRSKAAFYSKVADRVAPGRLRLDPDDTTIIPRLIHIREVDADFDLNIELDEMPYDLFGHFYFQTMLRIKDDARVLAVPTGDEDEASRRARLSGYFSLGLNAVNLAALFVPLLGEAMMVVAGAQLLTETFQGIDAWSHSDMDEALEHLGSVAENLAFMAAFGALVKAGQAPEMPPLKRSSFIDKLVPTRLPGGEIRLASPDPTPFTHDSHLPDTPLPGAADVLQRVALDQEIHRFRQQINDVAAYTSADAQLQMELLVTLPGWPVGRPIHVLDTQGLKIAEYGSSALPQAHPNRVPSLEPLLVRQTQIADGQLLQAVIEGLGEGGQNRVFARSTSRTPETLAAHIARIAEGRSAWLFDRLYEGRDVSNDPLVNLIKRDFPALPVTDARELLSCASAEQIAGMTATGRVPLEIAGKAHGYVQQIRIDRVLEGFCLVSKADNVDTLKVSLGLLGDLPGWPNDLRLDVRDGAWNGELIESLGKPDALQRRVLIKRGLAFQAVDGLGTEPGQASGEQDNFFSAVLQALPEASRQAMGFLDVSADAAALRNRIIDAAFKDRPRLSKILRQWALKPGVRWPGRLADGRIGYKLSGRGQLNPEAPRFEGQAAARRELVATLRTLYPEAADIEGYVLRRLINNGNDVQTLLNITLESQREFDVLRSVLEGWVEVGGATQTAARRSIAEAISHGWRSSQMYSPLSSRGLVLESVDFSLLEDLPELSEYLGTIRRITLDSITTTEEQMNRFLQRFLRLTRLEILGSGLNRVPQGLGVLSRLTDLSFEDTGLTIDQAAMDLFMSLPDLEMLDVSGNTLGDLTDTSRLHVTRLYMANMQLTEWPDWTHDLLLNVLDVSGNQIVHLPRFLIDNEQGPLFQMTVYGSENPFDHDELLECWLNQRDSNMYELEYDFPASIRDRARSPTTSEADYDGYSSDGDNVGHNHSFDQPQSAPTATVSIWIVEGRTELNSRICVAWNVVEQAGDAPNLLILLQRLRESRDFTRVHEELASDVMRVLEAAAENSQLRAELEIMANDRLFGADQTCQDGARLIFSDIQVAVYAEAALRDVPEAQQTEVLFGVIRSLFRLNEVQVIADVEIATREARGVRVDPAEVRMAYRIGLATELNLPGQPVSMVWDRVAAVEHRNILDAGRVIRQREAGPEFLDYALADRRWTERLRVEYQADLQRVTAPIRAEQEALLEHPPVDMAENLRRHGTIYERLNAAHAANDRAALAAATRDFAELNANPPVDHDEFDRQGRALIARLAAAEKALLEQLTNNLRQNW